MILTIAAKELRHNILNLRFSVIYGMSFLAVLTSLSIFSIHYHRQRQNYVDAQRQQRRMLELMDATLELRWNGTAVQRPPSPLSIFCAGLDKEMSRTLYLPFYRGYSARRPKSSDLLLILFCSPDMVFVVNVVLSILALSVACDAICGEHQTGTLKLIMANAVPRNSILVGKWLGGYAAVVCPFLLSVACGLCITLMVGGLPTTGDFWMRLGALVLLSVLYLAVFFTAGLCISTFSRNSSAALVTALFVWILAVFFIPHGVQLLARQAMPVSSPAEFSDRKGVVSSALFERYLELVKDASTDEERSKIEEDIAAQQRAELERLTSEYERELDRQIVVTQILMRISPSPCYLFAATSLAGTGLADFRSWFNYLDTYEGQHYEVLDGIDRTSDFDPAVLPKFEPPTIPFTRSLLGSLPDIVVLLILSVVLFLLSYLRFMRYDLCK